MNRLNFLIIQYIQGVLNILMDNNQKCYCKWKSCKRHGKCEECIDHHSQNKKYPLPFCKNNPTPNNKTTSKDK